MMSTRAELLGRIPRCDAVTTGTNPVSERAWQLALRAAIGASRGDCKPALDATAEVQNLDPELHTAIFGHPEVTSCVQREAARQQSHRACLAAHTAATHAAMSNANLQARTAALRRLPICTTAK